MKKYTYIETEIMRDRQYVRQHVRHTSQQIVMVKAIDHLYKIFQPNDFMIKNEIKNLTE